MFSSKQPYSCTAMYTYSTSMTKPYKHFKGPPTKALSLFKLLISTADWSKFYMNKWNEKIKLSYIFIIWHHLQILFIYTLFVTLSILWCHNNDVNVCYICYNLKSTEEPIRRKRFGLNFERNGVWCYCLLKTFLLYRYQGFIRLYTIYIYICWHSRIVVLFLKRYNTKMEWTQYRKGK